jgi:hypothetical protein
MNAGERPDIVERLVAASSRRPSPSDSGMKAPQKTCFFSAPTATHHASVLEALAAREQFCQFGVEVEVLGLCTRRHHGMRLAQEEFHSRRRQFEQGRPVG